MININEIKQYEHSCVILQGQVVYLVCLGRKLTSYEVLGVSMDSGCPGPHSWSAI